VNALEQAIEKALHSEGENKAANKAYLEFIKANFIIPIQQESTPEAPKVLFLQEGEHTFLPVFTSMDYLANWAQDIADNIQILELTGVNLLKGIGDNVTICLNINSPIYKEFNPAETARMRSMVLKLWRD